MAHLHGRDFKKSLVLNYFKQLSVDSIVYLYLFTKRFNWRLLCEDANDLSSVVIASVLACRNNEPEQYERINQTLALVTNLDVSVEMLGRLKHMDAILACEYHSKDGFLKNFICSRQFEFDSFEAMCLKAL
jgi:hypothetical protein